MQIAHNKKPSTEYLKNLAKQNMKKNKRSYFIYFQTLVFSIALFYMFNSIGSQFEMLGIEDTLSYLPFAIGLMMVISIFTSCLTAFLIVYSNRLIILKRKKEFGIYLTLGMSHKDIAKLISRENRQIGFFALVIGIVFGVFLSQALALITGKIIGIGIVSFRFIFSPVALICTVLLVILVLYIVQIYNKKQLKSLTILELLSAEEKNEKIAHISKMKLLSTVVAILVWGLAYMLMIKMPFSFAYTFTYVLFGIGLGNTLIIFSGMDLFIRFREKHRSRYYKGIEPFTVSQLRKRITSSSLSLSIVTMVLFISFLIMPMGINLGKEMMENLEHGTPYDVSFTVFPDEDQHAETLVENSLNENHLSINDYFKDYAQIGLYVTNELDLKIFNVEEGQTVQLLKLSDYNKLLELQELPPVQLKDYKYILNVQQTKKRNQFEQILRTDANSFKWQEQEFTPDSYKVSTTVFETSNIVQGSVTVILPDKWLEHVQLNRYIWNGNFKGNQSSFMDDYREQNINLSMNTKDVVTVELTTSNITISYIAVYVGLSLLFTSLTILLLHLLSQEEKSLVNYKILRELGVSKKIIQKSALKQQFIYYSLPFFIAFLHAYAFNIVTVTQFANLTTWSIIQSIILSFGLMFGLYGFYFVLAFQYNRNLINGLR